MSQKKILLLQSRPEQAASDNEFDAFCIMGGIDPERIERVRMETGVFPTIDLDKYSVVLMGGGPANFAYQQDEKTEVQRAFEPWLFSLFDDIRLKNIPFFGACLGIGALVTYAGGSMSFDYGEAVGAVEISVTEEGRADPVFKRVPGVFSAFVGHKEGTVSVPDTLKVLAKNETCIQAVRLGDNMYGTQFHPELDPAGLALRIEIYKFAGYFEPEEADDLIAAAWASDVGETATHVLRDFIKEYA